MIRFSPFNLSPNSPMTEPMATKARRAYSYIRFSTPEQARGRSAQRQIERTTAYCEEKGYILDSTLRDEGVSAYRGRNRKEGALGGFMRAVDQGLIAPGSVLIIESLDRLSREKVRLSQAELLNLINRGIEIVTLLDRQAYSAQSIDEHPWQLFTALGVAMRAHDESDTKSSRLKDVWNAKRRDIEKQIHVRQRIPAWLTWQDGRLVPIKERVSFIEGIFLRAREGWGRRRIIMDLNDRGIPPFGRAKGGWQDSYVSKLLRSRALLGEYQPHRLDPTTGRRVPVGEVVRDYFPAVLTPELWMQAQRNFPGQAPRKGRPGGNLFVGLVFDPSDAPMHLERKGSKEWVYIATALAYRRKGLPVYRWLYKHFEAAVLHVIVDVDWATVLGKGGGAERKVKRIRDELGLVILEEQRSKVEVEKMTQLLVEGWNGGLLESLRNRAQQAGEKLNDVRARRVRLEEELAAAERGRRDAIDDARRSVAELLQQVQDPAARERLAREIRNLIARIELFPDADIPGLEVLRDEARKVASSYLAGNRGLLACARNRVCGAIVLQFADGRKVVAWVTYRPGARTEREPRLIGVSEIGHDPGARKRLITQLQP